MQTLEILLRKMRWDPEEDPEDLDEDDRGAFETLRSELRLFLDSISSIDEELVTSAIKTLAMSTLNRADESVGWADAELSVYLVFLYGEFQKGDRCKHYRPSIIPWLTYRLAQPRGGSPLSLLHKRLRRIRGKMQTGRNIL